MVLTTNHNARHVLPSDDPVSSTTNDHPILPEFGTGRLSRPHTRPTCALAPCPQPSDWLTVGEPPPAACARSHRQVRMSPQDDQPMTTAHGSRPAKSPCLVRDAQTQRAYSGFVITSLTSFTASDRHDQATVFIEADSRNFRVGQTGKLPDRVIH